VFLDVDEIGRPEPGTVVDLITMSTSLVTRRAAKLTYGEESNMLCHMAALLHPPSSRVALAAFGKLADRWALDQGQRALLLGRSERTAYRLSSAVRADRPLQRDTLERISLLVGIYEDTRAVFGSGAAADGWIRRPNGDFGGEAPLDRLLAGNVQDIIEVRRYLALARQGW